ncbi:MAG: 50S ribosomal protein L9 [Myxococcota bacterium]
MMKIILQEDVPHLGVVGDLVQVKDGYARNFLIPQGKAVFASVRSIRELEHQRRIADHRRAQATAEASESKTQIEALSVSMQAKVAPPPLGDDGEPIVEHLPRLFGSITNRDIARVLSDSGVKVDHRRVVLPGPVRAVGKFVARIRLDGGIEAKLPFWVMPEGTEDVETEKKRIEEAIAAQEAAAKAAAEKAAEKAAEADRASRAESSKSAEADSADGEDAESGSSES